MTERISGVGFDVGTCFLVKAEKHADNVVYKQERDSFFSIEASDETKGILDSIGANYIEDGKKIYVVGEESLGLANMMKGELQRPLRNGVISNQEREAIPVLREIIKGVVGNAKYDGETLCYTVPAAPINANFDIVYHENILNGIFSELGYCASSINEAQCIVYSELADKKFTGISCSFGSGMSNVCLSMMGIPAVTFSIIGGGDSIDQAAARSVVGHTVASITAKKEKGINILKPNPSDDAEMAISIYYKNLIDNVVKGFYVSIQNAEKVPSFMEPVDIVVAGGTSLAGGFIDCFTHAVSKYDFPFEIGNIRRASDPINTVSDGALRAALIKERKKDVNDAERN